VKNSAKNRQDADSYSASEAAAILSVSIPTLKRMVAEARLQSFRTPGGHLRILADSLEAMRQPDKGRTGKARGNSPVLRDRQEEVEELTLEARRMRAKRMIARLHHEEEEEAEEREAQERARKEEAAQCEAALAVQRQRLAQEHAQRRQNKELERKRAACRYRLLEETSRNLATAQYEWLSAGQRKQIMDAVENEIEIRQPLNARQIRPIIAHTEAALVETYRARAWAAERRRQVNQAALSWAEWRLPWGATEAEKSRLRRDCAAILAGLPNEATEADAKEELEPTVHAIRQEIESRKRGEERQQMHTRILNQAVWELPIGRSEGEAAKLRRACSEILARLPADISEAEAKEQFAPTVQQFCKEINQRKADQARRKRKQELTVGGVREVWNCLLALKNEGEIEDAEFYDTEFREHMETVVRRELEAELTGNESITELKDFVMDIIEDEIE
jgi:excisionase family DNA binding protein